MGLRNTSRTGLTNSERSTLVGLKVGKWLDAHSYGLNVAYRLFAQRTLEFADDAHFRTDGKQRTWAGADMRNDSRKQLNRLKSVEATIGTIVACAARNEPRNTPTWVLDALEYAYGILN